MAFLLSLLIMPGVHGQEGNNAGQHAGPLYEASYALVIGNTQYNNGWPSISGVRADVHAVTEALESKGFHVFTATDLTKSQFDSAYSNFISRFGNEQDNRLLFYYAGHGHTVETTYGDKIGYLVPIDAPDPQLDVNEFLGTAIEMAQMEIYAKRIQSKHALFAFDACFAGSIFAQSRAANSAISYKVSQPVRQFISSGDENEQVPDISIFRKQFVDALTTPVADGNGDGYLTGTELGEFLQRTVIEESRNQQHPQYGKIRNPALDKGDFVFLVDPGLQRIDDRLNPSLGSISLLETDGSIELVSELEGLVYLDDEPVGELNGFSPVLKLNTKSGKHRIRIEGAENWWGTVMVVPGKTAGLNVERYHNTTGFHAFMELVSVEGGEFQMGSGEGLADQRPAHLVKLDDFEIGAYEVTVGQYAAFVEETGYETEAERGKGQNLIIGQGGDLQSVEGMNWRYGPNGQLARDSQPVIFITWNDAVAFTEWMTERYPGTYRLPTEAQWEYAARGGNRRKNTTYSGTNSMNKEAFQGYFQQADIAKALLPNEIMVYDMSGGVAEWCLDWYDMNYYRQSSEVNPTGPLSGQFKVLRGGSWLSDEKYSRVTYRNKTSPGLASFSEGFRVVRIKKE